MRSVHLYIYIFLYFYSYIYILYLFYTCITSIYYYLFCILFGYEIYILLSRKIISMFLASWNTTIFLRHCVIVGTYVAKRGYALSASAINPVVSTEFCRRHASSIHDQSFY